MEPAFGTTAKPLDIQNSVPTQTAPIRAGADPAFDPSTGIINMDKLTGAEDPTTVLMRELVKRSGRSLAELKDSYHLEKGFRDPTQNGPDRPIEIHVDAGTGTYYFTRHWVVNYKDANGIPQQLHFTKKIYTSIECPTTYSGPQQERQQYMASIVARAYVKVEEARMHFAVTGEKTELYLKLQSEITKIANDRFITITFFDGADEILANPTKDEDFKSKLVSYVRYEMRAGSKSYNASVANDPTKLESKSDANVLVKVDELSRKLTSPENQKAKQKLFVLVAEHESAPHVKKIATLLKKDEILDEIERGITRADAFKKANITESEVYQMEQSQLTEQVDKFYSDLRLFGEKEFVNKVLMNRHGDNHEIPKATLDLISPDKGVFESLFGKEKKKDPLAFFKAIHENYAFKRLPADVIELLQAYRKAYLALSDKHEDITKIEKEILDMQFDFKKEPALERVKTLETIKNQLDLFKDQLPQESMQKALDVSAAKEPIRALPKHARHIDVGQD